MKRLWSRQGLTGLLKRNDKKAAMVEESKRTYSPNELIDL